MCGRENYVISQALYFGIKHIQAQQEPFKDNSNMWDMADLLEKKYPAYGNSIKQLNPEEFEMVMKAARWNPADLEVVK